MSDHKDSDSARSDPQLDISDVYLFAGKTGVVFVMNVNPLSGAGGFHHECTYTFNVDRTGDAVPDLALKATFGDPDTCGRQPVTLRMSAGKTASDPTAAGRVIASGHTGENLFGGGFRLFAGPAADPFYIEPTVVTAVRTAVVQGTALDLSGFDPATAHNLFAGTNVQTIVIEVPVTLFGIGNRIGFWGGTWLPLENRRQGYRQIDRAANPLVSTLFGQDDPFGAALPANDVADYGELFRDMTAQVVAANHSAANPAAHAAKVVAALLPDVLTYIVGTTAYWKAKPPPGRTYARNGRDLTGNHPNEMFTLILNKAVDDHLDASAATGTLRPFFPYLSKPL